jgi:multiple sugar transport system permease protein
MEYTERPITVTGFVGLWALVIVLHLIELLAVLAARAEADIVAISFILEIALLFFAARGHEWARWALAALFAATLIDFLLSAADTFASSTANGFVNVAMYLAGAIGLVLVFLPSATAWYRNRPPLAQTGWVSGGSREAGARSSSMRITLYTLVAVIITLVFFFPLYWAISNSLRQPAETFTVAGIGFPFLDFTPTLNNWIEELQVKEASRSLTTSLIVASASTVLALVLGLPAAYALARFRFRRIPNKDLTVWFLSQRVLPPVATAVPFFFVFTTLGMQDTRGALILINATFILPFVVVIVRQTFQDLPIELEEAALVDGASYLTAFFRVALPLAAPAVAASALIMFAFAWNEYLFAQILSLTEASVMPTHIAGGADTRGVQFWFVAVRSLIAMVPPVLLALFAQRYIVRGLTLGAVKG